MRRRAAARIAGRLGVVALALGLAGCGGGTATNGTAGSTGTAGPSGGPAPVRLCLDVVLPRGRAADEVLAGVRQVLGRDGVPVARHQLALCSAIDSARRPGAAGVADAAVRAVSNPRTVAVIGGLSDRDAELAGAVLAPADIPFLSLSPAAPADDLFSAGRSTVVRLVPPAGTEHAQAAAAVAAEGCGTRAHPGRRDCVVLDPTRTRLCTGLGPHPGPLRICLVPGAVAAGAASPATAYGSAAARLVLAALQGIAATGRDLADRANVLAAITRAELHHSPVGPLRLDASATATPTVDTLYAVAADGRRTRLGLLRPLG